ncbi:MAG: hypothetical protein NVS3B21_34330 [Acidimicrobiales bacterium]
MGLTGVFLIADAVRISGAVNDLREGTGLLQGVSASLGTSPGQWDPATVATADRQRIKGSRLVNRGAELLVHDPVLAAAGAIPLLRDQVTTASDIARAAQAGSAVIADSVAIARVYGEAASAGGSQPEILLRFLNAAEPNLVHAHHRLGPPDRTLHADLDRPLLPQLRSAVVSALRPLDNAEATLSSAQGVAHYLPEAIGASAPKTYLLLLANPTELRPTGGFYGAVGYVTLNKGAPNGLEIQSDGVYERRIHKDFPIPPALGHYLIFPRNSLQIGDAGWDPDFPTSAAFIESMMKSATGREVDGTITFDPYAVEALLAVIGPIEVPGYGRFTSQDFFTRLNIIVNVDPNGDPAAIGTIGQVVISRILAQPADQWPKMWAVLGTQAHRRHAAMFSHDSGLRAELAKMRFDGGLLDVDPGDDYLAVVEANVGGTKGDAYVHKTMQVKVERYSTGITRHEVAVRYEMPLPKDAVDIALNPHSGGAYRNYLRFYLPEAASVHALYVYIDGKPTTENSLDAISIEHGKRMAATFLNIPRGHSAEVHLYYEVALNSDNIYSLLIQKQAGTPGSDGTMQISLPGKVIRRQTLNLSQDVVVKLGW